MNNSFDTETICRELLDLRSKYDLVVNELRDYFSRTVSAMIKDRFNAAVNLGVREVAIRYRKDVCQPLEGSAEAVVRESVYLFGMSLPRATNEAERDSLLECIYGAMQGENWSPNGEARALIRALGLTHTSMSIGDLIDIRNFDGEAIYQVAAAGFRRLK